MAIDEGLEPREAATILGGTPIEINRKTADNTSVLAYQIQLPAWLHPFTIAVVLACPIPMAVDVPPI